MYKRQLADKQEKLQTADRQLAELKENMDAIEERTGELKEEMCIRDRNGTAYRHGTPTRKNTS